MYDAVLYSFSLHVLCELNFQVRRFFLFVARMYQFKLSRSSSSICNNDVDEKGRSHFYSIVSCRIAEMIHPYMELEAYMRICSDEGTSTRKRRSLHIHHYIAPGTTRPPTGWLDIIRICWPRRRRHILRCAYHSRQDRHDCQNTNPKSPVARQGGDGRYLQTGFAHSICCTVDDLGD